MKTDSPGGIYVAGHQGLVGSALVRSFSKDRPERLLLRSHDELDLTVQADVRFFLERQRPDVVFLAAAKVGGILANSTRPAEFIFSNLAIQTNVIHESWRSNVKRLLFLGSSCVYPREAPTPICEEHLLTGSLEETNQPYAVAKIAGIKMCAAYARQYGCDFRCLMATNLFGPGDNYDLLSSHFLPATIRKCHLAKLSELGDIASIHRNEGVYGEIPVGICKALGLKRVDGVLQVEKNTPPVIEVWGSGKPRRELLLVDDLADACRMISDLPRSDYDKACTGTHGENLGFLNAGSGEERSIAELSGLVREIVGTRSRIVFDSSKPDGTSRKLIDSSRIRSLGWSPTRTLEEGIKTAFRDYIARLETATVPSLIPTAPSPR